MAYSEAQTRYPTGGISLEKIQEFIKTVAATLKSYGLQEEGELVMLCESKNRRMEAARALSSAELLECPVPVGLMLSGSAQSLQYRAGEVIFHRSMNCLGLYLVLSGRLLRQGEWNQSPLELAPARAGELLELAAVLGDGQHHFTLTAQTPASVLLLPMEAVSRAFQVYSPLRMKLLEGLAREVSRAYYNCALCRHVQIQQVNTAA